MYGGLIRTIQLNSGLEYHSDYHFLERTAGEIAIPKTTKYLLEYAENGNKDKWLLPDGNIDIEGIRRVVTESFRNDPKWFIEMAVEFYRLNVQDVRDDPIWVETSEDGESPSAPWARDRFAELLRN